MNREEAIEQLQICKGLIKQDGQDYLDERDFPLIDMAIEALSEPKIGWIPVSERLPEIGQKVLASTKSTVFTQVYKGIYSEPNVWHWEHNSIKVVTAWMPLPPVYQGE